MGIEELLGKTLTKIDVTKGGKWYDEIVFTTEKGERYKMYHNQDCCESVTIDDIVGDTLDLIGSPITMAEEVSSKENPPSLDPDEYEPESMTWTFYKLATVKGYVTIRWYGTSNGFYSESVDFEKIEP